MKRFIRQTALFVAIFFLVVLGLFFIANKMVKGKASFKIKEDTKYVIFGHSHPECTYNDSLIQHFQNFGNSGESYFYTQTKIREVVKQNPAIETIFVEFTNNQIDELMNDWIWLDKYMTNRYPVFEVFMDKNDHFLLLTSNFTGFVNSFSLSIKSNFERIIASDYNFTSKLGGYLYLKKNKVDSFLNEQVINPPKEITIHKTSNYNIEYLEKIVAFCQSQNKQVVLLRSPQHNKCLAMGNEEQFKEILQTNFADILFLDFNEFPASNDEFADLEHLNYKGAKRFSIWFNALLQNGLLSVPDKQKVIDSQMRILK